MISAPYVQTMARYNVWQNANIYEAAGRLPDAARKENRGAFFGSIHATLNHILWADQTWLSRFGGSPRPAAQTIAEGLTQFGDWDVLTASDSLPPPPPPMASRAQVAFSVCCSWM